MNLRGTYLRRAQERELSATTPGAPRGHGPDESISLPPSHGFSCSGFRGFRRTDKDRHVGTPVSFHEAPRDRPSNEAECLTWTAFLLMLKDEDRDLWLQLTTPG